MRSFEHVGLRKASRHCGKWGMGGPSAVWEEPRSSCPGALNWKW